MTDVFKSFQSEIFLFIRALPCRLTRDDFEVIKMMTTLMKNILDCHSSLGKVEIIY